MYLKAAAVRLQGASGRLTAGTLTETVTLLLTLMWPATQVAGSGGNASAEWRAAERG